MTESTPNQDINEFEKYDYFNSDTPGVVDLVMQKLEINSNEVLVGSISKEFLATQVVDDLLETHGKESTLAFFENVFRSQKLINHFKRYPETIEELVNIAQEKESIFEEPKNLDAYITNSTQRQEEGERVEERLRDLKSNPKALNKEEVEAGVYKEELEEQVADAVFTLRKKGYNSFESGFTYDRVHGIQSIGFSKEVPPNFEIPENVISILKNKKVEISIEEQEDRYSIFLTPIERTLPFQEWKIIWDIVAEGLPPLDKEGSNVNVHTPLAKRFRGEME